MANKLCKWLAQTFLLISISCICWTKTLYSPCSTHATCHLHSLFFPFPWQSGIETNLHPPIYTCSPPSLTQGLPSLPLSPCCCCIVVSFRTSQCLALMMCAAVGGLYKDFPGVLHLSFSSVMKPVRTNSVPVTATMRKQTNLSVCIGL